MFHRAFSAVLLEFRVETTVEIHRCFSIWKILRRFFYWRVLPKKLYEKVEWVLKIQCRRVKLKSKAS